jgi:peptide chain release factor 1
VRVTHLPTGLVVACQDEKSQLKNKRQSIEDFKARLLEIEQQKQNDAIAENRKSQVGSGDRSEPHPHLQFPAGACDGSPHQSDAVQARTRCSTAPSMNLSTT